MKSRWPRITKDMKRDEPVLSKAINELRKSFKPSYDAPYSSQWNGRLAAEGMTYRSLAEFQYITSIGAWRTLGQ